ASPLTRCVRQKCSCMPSSGRIPILHETQRRTRCSWLLASAAGQLSRPTWPPVRPSSAS
ncbi:uncharacterized protein B0I36DRAFT_339088, partial [Microdochium trichocladiopsis]